MSLLFWESFFLTRGNGQSFLLKLKRITYWIEFDDYYYIKFDFLKPK